MRLLLAALALALAALLGSRLGFRPRSASVGVRLLFSSGSHFLLLGFLLGPRVAGVLREELFLSLAPFVALGLGWIGLLFGLQFERETLRRFTREERAVALAQAVIAFLLLVAFGLGLGWSLGGLDRIAILLILAAAAAGAIASPTGIAVVFGALRVRGPVSRLLSLAGSLDGVVGITALAFVFALFRPGTESVSVGALRWVLVSILLGIWFGWLFISLTRGKPAAEELVLFLLGLGLLIAGAHLSMAASTLFGSFVAGALIANLAPGPRRRRVYAALKAWETPLHIIFLLLAGSLLPIPDISIFALVIAYVVARAVAKGAGGLVARRSLGRVPGTRGFGLGLLSQGGISIAMAVSVYLVLFATPSARGPVEAFFATIVLGTVANEILGPHVLVRLLSTAGETDTSSGAALS